MSLLGSSALVPHGNEKAVEVNQRALIHQVLARYSGEFTLFRELLQNSDDAEAEIAEIHFRTRDYRDEKVSRKGNLPDLGKTIVHEYVFRNSGNDFTEQDWNRLKKIAAGNPDEQKIGAFGVGFYCTFSVCDSPMVTSGSHAMLFYFKDGADDLQVKRGPRTAPSGQRWTTFQMELRQPSPMPNPLDVARFVATSLSFMRKLSKVTIWFDDVSLCIVSKETTGEHSLKLPRSLKTKSSSGFMNVDGLAVRELKITASVVAALSSPDAIEVPANRSKEHKATATMSVYSARAAVQLESALASELERSTKKKVATQVHVDLVYTGKESYESIADAQSEEGSTSSVFRDLVPDLDGSGRSKVFIGHATSQSTGFGGHLSARFIPTVEREALDFQDRNVGSWNRELLFVGGYLARSVYELELALLDQRHSQMQLGGSSVEEAQAWLREQTTYMLRYFAFHPSHPSQVVSEQLQDHFFNCSQQKEFRIISTKSIIDTKTIRLTKADIPFLQNLPVIPTDIAKRANQMIECLRRHGLLFDVQITDVVSELRPRNLTEHELIDCLRWWMSIDLAERESFRDAFAEACSFTENQREAQPHALSTIRSFIACREVDIILQDGPLPAHTLPYNVSGQLEDAIGWSSLIAEMKWNSLTVQEWISYLAEPNRQPRADYDITRSVDWAERVLERLAHGYTKFNYATKASIKSALCKVKCIPTRAGIKEPGDAFFHEIPNDDMFDDLAIVRLPTTAVVRDDLFDLLKFLGVREHIEIPLVYRRMVNSANWSGYDLVRYLCSIRSKLSNSNWASLSDTPAFHREAPEPDDKRFLPQALFPPTSVFREMKLDILKWDDHPWDTTSEEAFILAKLGLPDFPPLKKVLGIASGIDGQARSAALDYFLANLGPGKKYADYDSKNFLGIKFIPSIAPDGSTVLQPPLNVFSHAEAAIFGFSVLDPSIAEHVTHLGLEAFPTAEQLLNLLRTNPTKDKTVAQTWFEAMARRTFDFSAVQLESLKTTRFIPTDTKLDNNLTTWLKSPEEVFFGVDGGMPQRPNLRPLFILIDFSEKSRIFLKACGVAEEPNTDQVARALIENPRQFYKLSGGYYGFLAELKSIAANESSISQHTLARLRGSASLVATRLIPKTTAVADAPGTSNDGSYTVKDELVAASDAVINDDQVAASIFAGQVVCAPTEANLEAFYSSLGAPRLSSLIREEFNFSGDVKDPASISQCERLRDLILERLPLFYNDLGATSRGIKLKWDQLRAKGTLQVSMAKKIERVLTLKQNSSQKNPVHIQVASASVQRPVSSPNIVRLCLSNSVPLDMHEVAQGLCRLVIEAPRVQDSVILFILLTTELRTLRGHGYNVDFILLQRQQAERRALEEALAAQRTAESNPQPMFRHSRKTTTGQKAAPASSRSLRRLWSFRPSKSDQSITSSGAGLQTLELPRLNVVTLLPTTEPAELLPPAVESLLSLREARVTPLEVIGNSVRHAIAACSEEATTSAEEVPSTPVTIKEAQGEGYCDVSADISDLNLESTHGIDVYISRGLPDREAIIRAKLPVIKRFLWLISQVRTCFELQAETFCLFYDGTSPTVAFNCNGDIFVNLRFYEEWHDTDIVGGNCSGAFKCWFFTIAHEIAHNLIREHGSQHEFYFSAISQAHISKLASLLHTMPL
ncbi:hypothetical protein BKA62DRAFT_97201 [Auriculariales sp. MPI-PUGE-AT-0066]|nr:hypothetical protein BKA62DRAFT_97201 [Auriculariales sp. MPI-PUGE-AT-0066]